MHRLLVIGTGSIGERHIRCFLGTSRATVGICEINDRLREEIAVKYNICGAFSALEDALKTNWDAAIVATPAHTHIPISLKLANAGVNLLIEKPLSTSNEGIAELAKVITAKKLVTAVAYIYRAHPVLSAMKLALDSGRFGKPLQLVAVCGQSFPFYRAAYRDTYYADRRRGGGAIQDALTHILNAGEWLVGPINRLCCDAMHKTLPGVEVEDTVHLICRHGEVMGNYSLNQYQAPNEVTITVVCEKGTLRFELHRNHWRWMTEPSSNWHDEAMAPMERDDWFILQENAFLDALKGKAEPLCTFEQAQQTLKVQLAAMECLGTDVYWKKV
ncbi:MAG: Gfo/Idh/MocA family oxidoreductase [Actinobacteria bacterium]|nr:Gfo/Idh/MocA family oxidoreductase [Actinomycetota bacterium]